MPAPNLRVGDVVQLRRAWPAYRLPAGARGKVLHATGFGGIYQVAFSPQLVVLVHWSRLQPAAAPLPGGRTGVSGGAG